MSKIKNTYVDGVNINIPPKGLPGKIVKNKEGMDMPGATIKSKKTGAPGNHASFRSTAAKSLMR